MSKNYKNAARQNAATSAAKKNMRNTNKEQRREMAKKHVALMSRVFGNETAHTVETATEYKDGDMFDFPAVDARTNETDVSCLAQDCVSAAIAAKRENPDAKVCIHDFASFMHQGGGYMNGAQAQEEQLCAESNLYNVLDAKSDYYCENKNWQRGGLYTSRALYLDDVCFLQEGTPVMCDVLVIAAPNRRVALDNGRTEQECANDLQRRVNTLLNIAAAQNVDVLITGAFGCGAFGNDWDEVAKAYRAWLDEHDGVIPKIVFCFVNAGLKKVFNKIICDFDEELEAECVAEEERVAAAAEEIDEEDWRDYMTCG